MADLTSSFISINLEDLERKAKLNREPNDNVNSMYDAGEDIEEFWDTLNITMDYSLLPLVTKFMSNLLPLDLEIFFDEFTGIDSRIFQSKGFDYTSYIELYKNTKHYLKTDYIQFLLQYYSGCLENRNEVQNENQIRFLDIRNMYLKKVLPEIGKKLSRDAYKTIIVDDNNNNSRI